ncbi:MAG: DUF655 domain-containing protein [Vulcanisaeta sp. AZ3]|jgi:putative nucleotide binding protein|nr:MAG: hypothetical protein TU36_04820 [Vulcanisaeta sp. AZ3]
MVKREDYAYILDVIPPEQMLIRNPSLIKRGFPRNEAYAQAIGEQFFTLLELTLKPEVSADVGERVYIGSGVRDKVNKIVGRVAYDDLTNEAKKALPEVITKIVKTQESKFVDFFNKAGPITLKMHSLELLRGIGKKTLWQLLEERRKKPFQSFEDIKKRIGIDPEKLIIDRILRELQGADQYKLFVG